MPDFFDPEHLANQHEREFAQDAGSGRYGRQDGDVPDTEDLWFVEDRTDVADWLTEHGWEVTSLEAAELITRYGRCSPGEVDDASPRTVFVEGKIVC